MLPDNSLPVRVVAIAILKNIEHCNHNFLYNKVCVVKPTKALVFVLKPPDNSKQLNILTNFTWTRKPVSFCVNLNNSV